MLAANAEAKAEIVSAIAPVIFACAAEERADIQTVIADVARDGAAVDRSGRIAADPFVHRDPAFQRKRPGVGLVIIRQETDPGRIFEVGLQLAVGQVSAEAGIVLVRTAGRKRGRIVLAIERLVIVDAAAAGKRHDVALHLGTETIVADVEGIGVEVARVDQEMIAEFEAAIEARDRIIGNLVADNPVEPAVFVADVDIVFLGERPGGECESRNGGSQGTNHGEFLSQLPLEPDYLKHVFKLKSIYSKIHLCITLAYIYSH